MASKNAKYLKNPSLLYLLATSKGLTRWIPDKQHLQFLYRAQMGKSLDLNNPRTFNEKLQWLKLHDRNPLYTKLVDKYAVKEWVAEKIGPQYVTKTYHKWDKAEDIDISKLPEKFVLKTNHDCGGIAICRDRRTFDLEAAKKKLDKHLRHNYFWGGREWPYKNVKPCVFAEEYLESDNSGYLKDQKLFHFSNGRIVTLLITDRFTESGLTETFFDEEWRPLELSEGGHPRKPDASFPLHLEEMKQLADKLACEFPFVRVDFYESSGRLFFGEMTFYPNSGFEHFDPEEWEEKLGSWIQLPSRLGWLLVNSASLMWFHEEIEQEEKHSAWDSQMTDYKFYCFNGEPRFLYVSQGLEDHDAAQISFLTLDWQFAPFIRNDYQPFNELPKKPVSFEKMIEITKKLSADIPFVRVDLYEINGKPRFSEMTFTPCSGYMPFNPETWDLKLGSMLPFSNRMSSKKEICV